MHCRQLRLPPSTVYGVKPATVVSSVVGNVQQKQVHITTGHIGLPAASMSLAAQAAAQVNLATRQGARRTELLVSTAMLARGVAAPRGPPSAAFNEVRAAAFPPFLRCAMVKKTNRGGLGVDDHLFTITEGACACTMEAANEDGSQFRPLASKDAGSVNLPLILQRTSTAAGETFWTLIDCSAGPERDNAWQVLYTSEPADAASNAMMQDDSTAGGFFPPTGERTWSRVLNQLYMQGTKSAANADAYGTDDAKADADATGGAAKVSVDAKQDAETPAAAAGMSAAAAATAPPSSTPLPPPPTAAGGSGGGAENGGAPSAPSASSSANRSFDEKLEVHLRTSATTVLLAAVVAEFEQHTFCTADDDQDEEQQQQQQQQHEHKDNRTEAMPSSNAVQDGGEAPEAAPEFAGNRASIPGGPPAKKSRHAAERAAPVKVSVACKLYLQYARLYAGCNGGLSDALSFANGVTAGVDAAIPFIVDGDCVEAACKDADEQARKALRKAMLAIVGGVNEVPASYNRILSKGTGGNFRACGKCSNATKRFSCTPSKPCQDYSWCTLESPCNLTGYVCFKCRNE